MTEKIKIDKEFKELIQPLTQSEYTGLKKSIEEEGFRDPFVIWSSENILLDGHHRYQVGEDAGWKEGYEIDIVEMDFESRDDAKVWIINNQLSRRNLPDHIQLKLHLKKKDLLADKGLKKKAHGKTAPGKTLLSKNDKSDKHNTRQQIADDLGWGNNKVAQGEIVLREAEKEPEVLERLNKGESTINKEYTQIKKKQRDRERDEKRKEDEERINSVQTIEEKLEESKFTTIVIDPPWHPDDQGVKDVFGRSTPTYSLMRMCELKEFPVGEYADKDSHLYLWVTNRMIQHGLELMNVWGFRYVTMLTWCKPVIGMGNYFRNNTEHVLFGVKGKLSLSRKDVGTWFEAPRQKEHSVKPDKFYELIESCSPGPYLDVFSRKKREGWVCYGSDF